MKERNFLSPKELKNKFKVNFTVFPNTDEILKIYNKILKRYKYFWKKKLIDNFYRMSLSKTQKRNWYEEDILLLLWVIRKYSCYINKHPDNLV